MSNLIYPDELKVSNISKMYDKKVVLKDINLNVKRGEVVGLFGPNGAGKTTCFNIILGLLKANSGTIKINDTDITHLPVYLRARMGLSYLPQESSVFRGLSVADNIKVALEVTETKSYVINSRLDALLSEFTISHLKDSLAANLSGGERRRLEIARALATNPKFIMFDEPLAGVDPLVISNIRQMIRHLKDANVGVLITDHNVRDTLSIVDRAYVIYGGQVLIEGTPEVISKSKIVREVYLGHSF